VISRPHGTHSAQPNRPPNGAYPWEWGACGACDACDLGPRGIPPTPTPANFVCRPPESRGGPDPLLVEHGGGKRKRGAGGYATPLMRGSARPCPSL
jgi:hypothetical protein